MQRTVPFRPYAIALGLALCGAVAFPAFASQPVTVTFEPNAHWVQEVDTVSRFDSSHDYSVAIPADKTFQINLITRDPNVFFTIKDETQRKQLVDTFKTGATTWSTKTTAPANYLIHVYVQPEAMQRDEKAKYALQIGQYGQSDLVPATTAVAFEADNPWIQEAGTLDPQATAHDYTVAIAAGQTLDVNLVTHDPKVHFRVADPAKGQTLVDSATTSTTTWSTPVAVATNYTISVYADPSAMPPGSRAGYVLQVGHYTEGNAQAPAAAGSTTSQPASTSTATPADTTNGAH